MIETCSVALLRRGFPAGPEILKWMDRNGERSHELAMGQGAGVRETARRAADGEIGASCRCGVEYQSHRSLARGGSGQGQRSGVRWADALSISVRPVITYWFMALYCAAKTAAFAAAVTAGAGWGTAILHAWTEADPGAVGRGAELLVLERKVKRGVEICCSLHLSGRFWTIGFGHLCDPEHPPVTEAEAEVWHPGGGSADCAGAATLRYCPVLATEPKGGSQRSCRFHIQPRAGRLQTSTLRRR